ncbi:MAG TPA: hypothetical protein DE147_14105 [Gammaproteobacteria bacterium]|nr:hypothetical protein [Gammaproteobacteria bacterium]
MEDPLWQGLSPASDFLQVRPNEGQPASARTEVRVAYSADTLYVAVICFDDDPAKLIVADSRRDADLDDLDSFQMIIDGFQDRQNGFVFGTTPAAGEYDGQVTRSGGGGQEAAGFNLNWDASWQVQTHIGDFGWSAEFAIPFKSLRYSGKGEQNWGINFQRNIARLDEVSYWAPLSRQYDLFRLSEAGTLTSVAPPSQRSIKVTPYVLGTLKRGGEDGPNTQTGGEVGFDAKIALTPSLTLDMTYNTDFAQVEVDEVQVNLDRFSIFLPEKRPFFLENAGQFSVGDAKDVELFFSRRIGIDAAGMPQPIDAGLRLSGKIGSATNVGAMHMQTGDSENGIAGANFSLLRLNQEFANRSSLGVLFIDKAAELSADDNQTYAVDGRLGVGDAWTFSGYAAKTDTPGLSGDDRAMRVRADYNVQSLDVFLSYAQVGDNFNPEVGFLKRKNYEKVSSMIWHTKRMNDRWGLFELRPHIFYQGYQDDEGFYESGFLHVDNHWEWTNGFEIHTGINFTREGVKEPFEINEGTVVPIGEYDHKESQIVVMTNPRKALSGSVTSRIGGFYGGDRNSTEVKASYRFAEALTSELSWSNNRIELPVTNGDFEVNVARLRLSYSFSPKVLLQALMQYDDRSDVTALNLRFSWLQTANSGLYLVYNELDTDEFIGPLEKRRELVIKYSRILDVL